MPEPRLGKPDPHLEEEEPPEFTMPQGVQIAGTPGDYEKRDINIQQFFAWMIYLFVSTALIIGIMYGAFHLLLRREEASDRLPSPLFAQKRVPPLPRLLPNRIDHPVRLDQHVPDPPEIGQLERRSENDGLARHRLLNTETGLPTIPADVAQRVIGSVGAAGAGGGNAGGREGLQAPMPSDSSGGIFTEDRTR